MKCRRLSVLVLCAVGLFAGAAATTMQGCKAGPAEKRVDQMIPVVQKAVDYKVQIDAVLARVASGELTDNAMVSVLRSFLNAEDQARLEAALARGQSVAKAAAEISAAAGVSAQALLTELQRLKADLATKQADDDATLQVIGSVVNVGLGLFGAGGIGTAVLALFNNKKSVASAVRKVGANITITPDEYADLSRNDPKLGALLAHEVEPAPTG